MEVVIEPPPSAEPEPELHLDQVEVFHNSMSGSVHVAHLTIVGRDPETGDIGYATLSNAPSVGSYIGTAAAGAGVAISGGRLNAAWPAEAIRRLQAGATPKAIADALAGTDTLAPKLMRTQLAIMSQDGQMAIASGERVARRTYVDPFQTGQDCMALCAGTKPGAVMPAMIESFEKSRGLPLPERLIVSLEAGQAGRRGGGLQQDAAPVAAALVVVRENGGYDGTNDRLVDLRVDLTKEPLVRLRNTYAAWVRGYLMPRLVELLRAAKASDPSYAPNQVWLRRIRSSKPLGEK